MSKDLLLLHGALGSKVQLQPLANELKDDHTIHLLDLPGHGDQEQNDGLFNIERFAEHLRSYIETHCSRPVNVFGYSMGGYVALYAAILYPSLFDTIMTLGTKLLWSHEVAEKETKALDPEMMLSKAPAFVDQLRDLHPNRDWKALVNDTQELMRELGNTNLLLNSNISSIQQKVLLMLGDKDRMVTLQETVDTWKQLPNAQLAVLPSTPHMIEKVSVPLLSFHIRHCLNS